MLANPNNRPTQPYVVFVLIAANVLAFVLLDQREDMIRWALWPKIELEVTGGGRLYSIFHTWQLLSYGFLHSGLLHLLLNMYGLWMFGRMVEVVLGPRRFIGYYLICLIGAGLVQLFVATQSALQTNDIYPSIGASGAVFGVALAFAVMFPNVKLLLLFPPVQLSAWLMIVIFAVISLLLGVTDTMAGVAHFAHLGGMAFGAILLWYWGAFRRKKSIE